MRGETECYGPISGGNKIEFAKNILMVFCLIFLVSFDQYVFLQFYCKTIKLSKIAKFQVRSFEK